MHTAGALHVCAFVMAMKPTSVLLSSIFFIADSVVSGDLMIANASSRSAGGLLQHM